MRKNIVIIIMLSFASLFSCRITPILPVGGDWTSGFDGNRYITRSSQYCTMKTGAYSRSAYFIPYVYSSNRISFAFTYNHGTGPIELGKDEQCILNVTYDNGYSSYCLSGLTEGNQIVFTDYDSQKLIEAMRKSSRIDLVFACSDLSFTCRSFDCYGFDYAYRYIL
ncbi:MAG: hypothetical protein SPJ34_04975 [Candidatus Ornithospirochaeta sp.]|nr:hypothetical protein [Candidatus Ornithospirochaeta sp.]